MSSEEQGVVRVYRTSVEEATALRDLPALESESGIPTGSFPDEEKKLPFLLFTDLVVRAATKLFYFNKILKFSDFSTIDNLVCKKIIQGAINESTFEALIENLQRESDTRQDDYEEEHGLISYPDLTNSRRPPIYFIEWTTSPEDFTDYLTAFRLAAEIFYQEQYQFAEENFDQLDNHPLLIPRPISHTWAISTPPPSSPHRTIRTTKRIRSVRQRYRRTNRGTTEQANEPRFEVEQETNWESASESEQEERQLENDENDENENNQNDQDDQNDNEIETEPIDEMAAAAEQQRTQFITTIMTKQFSGITAFKPLQKSFETLVRLYDRAGGPNHRQAMDEELKRELLLAILIDPVVPPKKGLDGETFIGAQSWIAEQEEAEIATYAQLVAKLEEKYKTKSEDIEVVTIVGLLKTLKQGGRPVDEYISEYEKLRDRVPAAELTQLMTTFHQVEVLLAGLDLPLLKAYVEEEKTFRTRSWADTKKGLRAVEVKIKYGEDPIFTEQRQRYHSIMTPNSTTIKKEQEDLDASAKRHRQQAAKYQQEKTELRRKLDESYDREQKLIETQKRLMNSESTSNDRRRKLSDYQKTETSRMIQGWCWNC